MANGHKQGVRRELEIAKAEIEALIDAVKGPDQSPEDAGTFASHISRVESIIAEVKSSVKIK